MGRGGGSIEDLWAFNDERVAYAIYESEIPVISAVGHEPDVTISDYVADLRAATPSNGAELAVPDQNALRQMLDSMYQSMASSLNRQLKGARQHLNVLSSSPALLSPTAYIDRKRKDLEIISHRLTGAQSRVLDRESQRFVSLTAKLDAMSPLKVLSRGYAIAQAEDNTTLRSTDQIKIGDNIRISFNDGKISATVTGKEKPNEREEHDI